MLDGVRWRGLLSSCVVTLYFICVIPGGAAALKRGDWLLVLRIFAIMVIVTSAMRVAVWLKKEREFRDFQRIKGA